MIAIASVPNEAWRRFRRNLEDYGWRVTAGKVAESLVSPLYVRHVYRIYRIHLGRWSPPRALEDSPFSFHLLTSADDEQIAQVEEIAEWLQGEVEGKLGRGDLCLAALSDGRVAGFNLITFGVVRIPLLDLTRTFRPGTAWSEQIAVHSDYRRQGLASELRRRIFLELRERGVMRLYGGALSSNTGSLELARRVGFTELSDVEYRRLLWSRGWRYHRVHADG